MHNETLKKLKLSFGGHSTAGVKQENQDAFTARLPQEHAARKFKGGVACLADGVSNSRNAKLASQTAVTNFASDYFSTPDYWTVKQSAQRVISAINAWLFQQGRQGVTREDGYVTTFSSLIIKSHTAHILHVGDSRVYLLRDGELELVTRDHNYRQGSHSILNRALGIDQQLDLDYHAFQVKQGDRFMLSSDGVHEHIAPSQLARFLSADGSLEAISQRIVESALANGSNDNASCLIVGVDQLPIERLSEAFKDVSKLVIPPVLSSGNKLDYYQVLRVLHSSTRSHAYLAKDLRDDKRVVIKAPSLTFQDDLGYLENFAREQWIGRKLQHPQIISLYPPPDDTQFLYHVSEFIEGQTLRQWMIDNPEPSLTKVREILAQMIKPVRALQRNKMIHRDLKPENFMIDSDGKVTLIDLGTIKVSGLDEIQYEGTNENPEGDLHYIAPEVLIEGTVSWRSDLFSLGAIVYEMLSGQPPYNCVKSNRQYPKRYEGWKYRPLNTQSTRDDLPTWVNSVLRKALEPRPTKRFEALSEFEQELNKPSAEILALTQHRPLIEKDPLLVWKGLCGLLFIVVCIQFYVISLAQ